MTDFPEAPSPEDTNINSGSDPQPQAQSQGPAEDVPVTSTPSPSADNAAPEPQAPAEPPAAEVPTPDEPASEPQVVTDSTVQPAPTVSTGQPGSKGSKAWLAVTTIVILVLIAAGAAAYYFLKPANKTAAAAKRDIPLINYGISDGSLSDVYPLGDSNTSVMWQVNSQVFDALVRFQDQTKIVPDLATNWYNPSNTTWVFKLRQGVKFNDGKSFTAQDVKDSLDYVIARQNDPNSSEEIFSLASTISSVKVNSPYQVTITTDGPDPILLNRLAQLYIFDTKAKPGDSTAGTGPYIIKPGTKPTATDIYLQAVNNYWGGHVYTKAVHIKAELDTTKLGEETAQGKFDIAGDIPDSQIAKIHSSSMLSIQDLGVSFLGINTENTNAPTSSLAARQAMAYALNVPEILKASNTRGTQASQLIPTTLPGHDPSITATPYNPTKAKQLLATVKNASTPIIFMYPSGDDDKANAIAKQLEAVGFNVKLSKQPDVNTEVGLAFSGKADIFYLSYTSNVLDGLDILSSVVLGNSDYNNDQLNSLATQAGSTIDPSARIKILQQMNDQAAKDIPDLPLYTQTRDYVFMKPYHVEVNLPSTEAGLYFWQVYQ